MAFKDLFKDNNDINEKSVVGFSSFIVMIIFALVDIITGIYGKEIVIQDYIYNSFVIIKLGSFEIAEVVKIFGKKKKENNKKKKMDIDKNYQKYKLLRFVLKSIKWVMKQKLQK